MFSWPLAVKLLFPCSGHLLLPSLLGLHTVLVGLLVAAAFSSPLRSLPHLSICSHPQRIPEGPLTSGVPSPAPPSLVSSAGPGLVPHCSWQQPQEQGVSWGAERPP